MTSICSYYFSTIYFYVSNHGRTTLHYFIQVNYNVSQAWEVKE